MLLDMLCRNEEEGPVRANAGIEGPRLWLIGLDVVDPEVDGREEIPFAVSEGRVLGMLGVAKGLDAFIDLSENGGEGGVGVSDSDTIFGGGVSKVGEEAVVVVGDNSERGEADTVMGCRVKCFSC